VTITGLDSELSTDILDIGITNSLGDPSGGGGMPSTVEAQ